MNQKPRAKACKECGEKFQPMNSLVKCCSIHCAIAYGKKEAPKQEKAKRRTALKAFNDSDKNILKRKAIQVFNTYIRKRDEKLPCVSCGYDKDARQFHAGHYRPAGNVAILRFNEQNVWKQCSICNNHLSGNLVQYRAELIKRIGIEAVEELESTNSPKQYSIEEYADIIKTFKSKLKELNAKDNF